MAGSIRETEYSLEFINNIAEPEQLRIDYELFFVLEGELTLTVDQTRMSLPRDGVFVVNAGQLRAYTADRQTLACRLTIPAAQLKRFASQPQLLLWCNSLLDSRGDYDRLRQLLRQLLNAHLRRPEQPEPMAVSYFFELLDCLCRSFLVRAGNDTGKENRDTMRHSEIAAFLEENYDQHLSLNDLAEHLHLTYAYLSRYLKKTLGINFLDYVMQVRLRHAVEDLLYTNKPITRVAVDNGFISSSALNKAFRDAYSLTPTEYREKMRGSREDTGEGGDLEKLYLRAKQVLAGQSADLPRDRSVQRSMITADGARRDPYRKNWMELVNIGRASDLLKSKVQEQLLTLKNALGFHYVRFWGVFDAAMELREGHDTLHLNFDRLDEVLDFLVENDLIPFLEMGDKPAVILRNLTEHVKLDEGQPIFDNIPEFRSVMTQFFHHLVTRYRAEVIRDWRFECWDDDRYHRQSESVSYFEIFNSFCDIVRSIIPGAVIGGCGMIIDAPDMESRLRLWMQQRCRPDFFSVMCYPYELRTAHNGETYYQLTTDSRFLVEQTARVRNLMEKAGMDIPLYVTEWNITLSSRNYINDSCYKGCYLLKNLVDMVGQADMVGYWMGSDLTSTFYDSQNIISGSPGLLSKDGITKPAFYAYRFLQRMGRYLIGRGKNYLITASGHFSYYIVCFNDQSLPASYYQTEEDAHTPASLRDCLDKLSPVHLNFCLEHLPAEQYTIKSLIVSPEYGSVMDEWLRLNTMTNIRREDIDYLRRICTPHMFIQEQTVKDGRISFPVDLDREEITLIHIYQTP